MPTYCVNKNAQPISGDHEVHDTDVDRDCHPDPENQVDLGSHVDCESAVVMAKTIYPDSNGCAVCAAECHTT
jgi:hypothetical protein